MAPVTASTNIDNPKIDFAGVDAGAKMVVGLKGCVGSAKANSVPRKHTKIPEPRKCQLIELRDRNLMSSARLIERESHLRIRVPSSMHYVPHMASSAYIHGE